MAPKTGSVQAHTRGGRSGSSAASPRMEWINRTEGIKAAAAKHPITLGRDFCMDNGGKTYAGVYTVADVVALVGSGGSFLYEYIRGKGSPAHLYFDLERPWTDAEEEMDLDALRESLVKSVFRYLQVVLREVCDEAEDLVVGENCQVAVSRYQRSTNPHEKFKFSAHVVVYANQVTTDVAKKIAKVIDARLQALPASHPDYKALVYHSKGYPTSVVDTGVYRPGCFRMLHCSKSITPKAPMVPFMGSSDRVLDHLICAHAGDNCPPPGMRFAVPAVDVRRIEALFPEIAESTSGASTGSMTDASSTSRDLPCLSVAAWTPQELAAAREALIKSTELAGTLRVAPGTLSFSHGYQLSDNVYSFYVDLKCAPWCPYASRVHGSNHICLAFNYERQLTSLLCQHPECRARQLQNVVPTKQLPTYVRNAALADAIDIIAPPSLHSRSHLVSWAEDYCEDAMRPYPVEQSIVVVRAGMGVGKSKRLVQHIQEHAVGARILFITFRCSLAVKLKHDMDAALGDTDADQRFVNYLDLQGQRGNDENKEDGMYTAARLIVQLDSLRKVKLQPYDFVIVDEVLSALLHTRSSVMKAPTEVLQALEYFTGSAKHVVLMDACADDMPSYNFVTYLERVKQVPAYWIRNRYVRPTTRKAVIHLCASDSKIDAARIQSAAMERVLEMVRDGKRVFCPSMSASYCDRLKELLDLETDNKITYEILTGADSNEKKMRVAGNINEALSNVQVAIISPTMTAGPSFEVEAHFSHIVAYAENMAANKGPTVDSFLQQLFRVRDLGDNGVMDIFVVDPPAVRSSAGPLCEEEIDNELQEAILHKYEYVSGEFWAASRQLGQATEGSVTMTFDRQSLAYTCLRGCVYMVHKSLAHFVQILKRTLEDDYAIPVEISSEALERSTPDLKKEMTKTVALKEKERGSAAKSAAGNVLISHDEAERLSHLRMEGKELSDTEQQQLWTYDMLIREYRMALRPGQAVDADVLQKYVGPFVPKAEAEKMKVQHTALMRLIMVKDRIMQSIQDEYQQLMDELRAKAQGSMELYSTPEHKFYIVAIIGSTLMETLYGVNWRAALDGDTDVVLPLETGTMRAKLLEWLTKIDDNKYDQITGALNISRRSDQNTYTLKKLVGSLDTEKAGEGEAATRPDRTATEFINNVLTRAFALPLTKAARVRNKYVRSVDATLYNGLLRLKQSQFDKYSFIDDLDPQLAAINIEG